MILKILKNSLFAIALLNINLYATESTETKEEKELSAIEKQNKKNLNIDKSQWNTKEYRTYREASDSEDIKEWTTKDFQKNQGGNTGYIGNIQMFINSDIAGQTAISGNPNEMTTEGLQKSEKFDDIESINAWTQDMQEDLISDSLNSSNKTFTQNGTVKCYITRNIPIRYKCTYPGAALTFGETMGEDGKKARRQCENECYEQFGCVSLVENPEIKTHEIDNIVFKIDENNTNDELLINEEITNETIVDKIQFDISKEDERKKVYLDIRYTNKKGQKLQIVRKLLLDKNNSLNLTISDIVKNIELKVYSEEEELELTLKNIKLVFKSNDKFICPKHQDLTTKNPGDFAHLCPSGNIIEFTKGLKNYKICADYGVTGENLDGTFASEDSCNSVCRTNHACVLDIKTFNTDILKEFQEGCIEGQTNCELDTCKELRLNGNRILNENVFRAGEYPIHTIINSTQQTGVKRPRPLLRDDIDYIKRNAEEWKDEAYIYMLSKQRYSQTVTSLDENTELSQAHQIGMYGANYGQSTSSVRALFAELKPRSYDVDSEDFNFFVVIDAIVEENVYNEEGKLERTKDRILFTRTSDTDDVFKPFAVKRNWGRNLFVENEEEGQQQYIHTDNETAIWECKTFDQVNNKWHNHSCLNLTEYYKSEKILLDELPTLRFPVINNLNNIIYRLPGIVRKVNTIGLRDYPIYTGNYDGTGEAISKFTVYTFYKNYLPNYQEIIDAIDNNELTAIYDNLSASSYAQTTTSDNGDADSDIKVYHYGAINKKSAYLRIFPKKEEVGKKGFIYVFGY